MASHVVDPYVILYVRRSADRSLLLNYLDSEGLALYGRRPDDAEMLASIRAHAAAAPPQAGLHFTGPSPVAIFVRGEVTEELLREMEDLLAAHGVLLDAIQLVAMPEESSSARLPFRFPLQISAIGSAAAPLVNAFETHCWAMAPEVQRYGFRVSALEKLPRSRKDNLPDIVVVTDAAVAARLGAWEEARRPRLIIAVGFTPPLSEARRSSHAWIVLPDAAAVTPRVVVEIVYAVIHDPNRYLPSVEDNPQKSGLPSPWPVLPGPWVRSPGRSGSQNRLQ